MSDNSIKDWRTNGIVIGGDIEFVQVIVTPNRQFIASWHIPKMSPEEAKALASRGLSLEQQVEVDRIIREYLANDHDSRG